MVNAPAYLYIYEFAKKIKWFAVIISWATSTISQTNPPLLDVACGQTIYKHRNQQRRIDCYCHRAYCIYGLAVQFIYIILTHQGAILILFSAAAHKALRAKDTTYTQNRATQRASAKPVYRRKSSRFAIARLLGELFVFAIIFLLFSKLAIIANWPTDVVVSVYVWRHIINLYISLVRAGRRSLFFAPRSP